LRFIIPVKLFLEILKEILDTHPKSVGEPPDTLQIQWVSIISYRKRDSCRGNRGTQLISTINSRQYVADLLNVGRVTLYRALAG
jgi:hypothetical protein